ncbi:MAG: hypothetical protein H6737_05070 [Alphaproteobacteria bacterium]|nr:hypothetical protein [Alphaproteobacteria bacterium]
MVWRSGDATARFPADQLGSATASRAGHLQSSFFAALALAMVAMVADLPVAWGIGALWLGAALRVALDRARPSVTITLDTGGDPQVFHTSDPAAFGLVQRLRARLPRGIGESSLDEMLHDALAGLRGPAGPVRTMSRWNAFWLAGFPLVVWAVLFLGALQHDFRAGEPLSGAFVVLAMGPPFSVMLWPVSGLPGLLIQAPLARPFVAWMNR